MTKILAIISTHGNELLGPNVLSYMLNKRSELLEYVDFMVANPRACSQNVRYVESDLNRSYGSDLDTYEARRSKAIEDRIKLLQPELVLDFHTTTAEQPDLLITANIEDKVSRDFINASVIKDVLVVEPLKTGIRTVLPIRFLSEERRNCPERIAIYKILKTRIRLHFFGQNFPYHLIKSMFLI
jgi:succinylglutamate desuccinylase